MNIIQYVVGFAILFVFGILVYSLIKKIIDITKAKKLKNKKNNNKEV